MIDSTTECRPCFQGGFAMDLPFRKTHGLTTSSVVLAKIFDFPFRKSIFCAKKSFSHLQDKSYSNSKRPANTVVAFKILDSWTGLPKDSFYSKVRRVVA